MKAILQRVLSASVTVEKEVISSIGKGVLIFAAVAPGDTEKEIDSMATKVLKMKLWDDEAGGRWKKGVMDVGGEVLCGKFYLESYHHCEVGPAHALFTELKKRKVSQFTLLARTKKGTKPDFHGAMNPGEASRLYHYFVDKVTEGYQADKVKNGKFQAMMEVALINDGPVTLEVEFAGKKAAEIEEQAN